jgi:hypothetical protein
VDAAVVAGALTGLATIALLRNGTLSSQVTAANARAANAVTSAQAAAKSDYAARNAALNREAARLKQQNQDVAAKIGELRANSIRAHGKYVVGHDIKSGTWHTVGHGGVSGSQCAYVVFSSVGKPSIPNFFDGPWTVHLSGASAFEIKAPACGCACHRPSRAHRGGSRTDNGRGETRITHCSVTCWCCGRGGRI